jgi:tRNA(Arg) A34 adenosine deaminase TadA
MTPTDIEHLRRCLQLATSARERGDEPFGSLLVTADGVVVAERENTVATDNDRTAHPELALASWACRNLDEAQRRSATMYTSGEHCPMCAAAQFWAGIGRLVFAMSGEHLGHIVPSHVPTLALGTRELFSRGAAGVDIVVEGPVPEIAIEVARLFDGLWAT